MDFDQANYFMAAQTTTMADEAKRQRLKTRREAALTLCDIAVDKEEAAELLAMVGLLDPAFRGVSA